MQSWPWDSHTMVLALLVARCSRGVERGLQPGVGGWWQASETRLTELTPPAFEESHSGE